MSDITKAINKIKSVHYGGYMRESIVEALEALDKRIDGPGVIYTIKGVVGTYESLPEDPSIGDVYTVSSEEKSYVWNGTSWELCCWWDF